MLILSRTSPGSEPGRPAVVRHSAETLEKASVVHTFSPAPQTPPCAVTWGEKEDVIMSTTDKVIPLLSMPWLSSGGVRLSTTPLPGLRPEVIQALEPVYPGALTPEMYRLLQTSCGLEGTALGAVDFTGRWHPEEPLSIFFDRVSRCASMMKAVAGSRKLPTSPVYRGRYGVCGRNRR